MKMTCEQFRARLDLYIDSELPVEERSAMEEHALACDECAALLDLAFTVATACAEMNEGLTVPAEAKAAWRSAVRTEAESAPKRRGRHRAPHARGALARTLYAVAAVLVVCFALGPMLTQMNLNDIMPNAATRTAAQYDVSDEAYYAPASSTYAMANTMPFAADEKGSFRLESDGAVADERSVDAGSANGGVIVLRSASRKAVTKTFDDAALWLDDLLREYGAYFESRRMSGQAENKNRTLSASIRVPSESLDDFLIALDEVGTVTLREESAEDITANYTDIAARLSVLRSQLDYLNAMNESAGSVSDLIEIHERATDLMSEIESYESMIRSWDSRRSYSTVKLTLNETAEVIETPETSLSERMKNAFHESVGSLSAFAKEMAVFAAAFAPQLVIIVPVLVIVIVLLRLAFGRKKKK